MADAAAILAQFGNHDPQSTITAAGLEHIELAVAATMLEKESNGRNVYGSDPGSTGGVYVKGGPVTKANYLAYRALAQTGRISRQGVGPAQCTSAAYQNLADSIGAPDGLGCWDPVTNMRAGFRGLGDLIRAYGLRDGARRYNGSGPMAERYAADFMAKYAVWKARLAGATVTPPKPQEDELSAQFEADSRARWAKEDLLDHDLRADLHVKQLELDGLVADVAGLKQSVAQLTAAVAGLAARQA